MPELTLTMTGGSAARGYSIALANPASYVEITNLAASGGAWVKGVNANAGDSTTAPTATPLPANDATGTYAPLLTQGANLVMDGSRGNPGATSVRGPRQVTHLLLWSTGNGSLVVRYV